MIRASTSGNARRDGSIRGSTASIATCCRRTTTSPSLRASATIASSRSTLPRVGARWVMRERLPNRRTLWMHAVLRSHLPAPARHVALTIGVHMSPNATDAYPSLLTIAEETGLSHGTVIKHLPELEFMGLLVIERGGGRGHPNRYSGQIPPYLLARLKDKQSESWTLSRLNSPSENGNSPSGEAKQSVSWPGSSPRSLPIEGASHGEGEPEPDLDGWAAAVAAHPWTRGTHGKIATKGTGP